MTRAAPPKMAPAQKMAPSPRIAPAPRPAPAPIKPAPVKSPIELKKPIAKPIASQPRPRMGEEHLKNGEIRMYKHGGAVTTTKVNTAQKGKKSKSGW